MSSRVCTAVLIVDSCLYVHIEALGRQSIHYFFSAVTSRLENAFSVSKKVIRLVYWSGGAWEIENTI